MRKFPTAALTFALLAGCSGVPPRTSADGARLAPSQRMTDTPVVAAPGAPDRVRASNDENANLERQLRRAQAQLVEQQIALEAEVYAREDAERRADEASRCLVGLASVERDWRGIVIAIEGAELFDAGKATLRAASSPTLVEVANLLLNQNSTHSVFVHAGDASSQAMGLNAAVPVAGGLGQRRAEALRAFFIARGIEGGRIQTQDEVARKAGKAPGELVFAPLSGLGDGGEHGRDAARDRIELVLRPPSATLSARGD